MTSPNGSPLVSEPTSAPSVTKAKFAAPGERRELWPLYRATFENAAVGIAHVDLDGRWLHANATMAEITGYSLAELMNLRFPEITHPDDLETDLNLTQRLLAGEFPHFSMHKRYIRKDGGVKWANMTVSLLRDDAGRPESFLSVVQDIDAQKDAELSVQRANEELEARVAARTAELERANKRMETFTYHVSHDLRAPLRTIISTSRILEDDFSSGLPEEARQLMARQVRAARSLGALIDDLLNLSRLSREELHCGPVDLTQLARSAAHGVLDRYPQSAAKIEVSEGLRATVDPRLLGLALENLLDNAVKYSPRGGTIRVERLDRAFVVRDEGIGMEPQYLEKIFEPFQRLHGDEAYPGAGIGLTSVRQVIERHGGRIWAESGPGQGSSFFFTLPD